ncbi:MAG: CRISPR-associated endonuclease Cas2 [Vulcanisaeta sp.]
MTYVIVFYDISDDRARQAVADKLLSKGLTRVQRSVFMGRGGHALAKDLSRYLSRFVGPSDSLLIIVVYEESVRSMIIIGRGGVVVNASSITVI